MPFDVLIIGAGFSGTLLAVQLLRQSSRLSIGVLEPNSLGRGLAYSSPHRFHLVNIPAGEMSALSGVPDDFVRWARAHFDASLKERSFPPRWVYGAYVEDLLDKTLEKGRHWRFQWVQGTAISAHQRRENLAIQTDVGTEILARIVVLATGSFPKAEPTVDGFEEPTPTYFCRPWSPNAIDNLSEASSVLLLGSGLTSLDLIMALKSRTFHGPIHVLSRKGLFPQARRQQRPFEPWPIFWNRKSPKTARGLLRLVRSQVHLASEQGVDWRAVIDSLRSVAQHIWISLSLQEQRRFLRHISPYWDVHRHRVAPEIADLLADMRAEGQVILHKGILTGLITRVGGADVSFWDHETYSADVLRVNRVINCLGSDSDSKCLWNPLVNNLFAQGLARPNALFLGLDVGKFGALIAQNGEVSHKLYTIGPPRKGALWETTTVPEIREQAAELARHLHAHLKSRRRGPTTLQKAV